MYDPFQNPHVSVDLFLNLYKSNTTTVRILEDKLEPLQLSLGRLCLLYALQRVDRPTLPSELGDDLAVTRANISGLLRGLEKSGMVRREMDTTDRRRIFVHLTPKGKEILQQAWPIYEETVAKLFYPLNHEEQMVLLSMLRKLHSNSSQS